MKDTKKAADLLIAVLILILSVVFYITADKMPNATKGIGPGDYPKVICTVLFILSLVQILTIVISLKSIPMFDFKEVNVKFLLRALLMVLMTFAYYFLLKSIGFLITTVLYLFGSFMLFGYKKKLKGAIIALVFTVVVYFLFSNVFMVFLPRGILG